MLGYHTVNNAWNHYFPLTIVKKNNILITHSLQRRQKFGCQRKQTFAIIPNVPSLKRKFQGISEAKHNNITKQNCLQRSLHKANYRKLWGDVGVLISWAHPSFTRCASSLDGRQSSSVCPHFSCSTAEIFRWATLYFRNLGTIMHNDVMLEVQNMNHCAGSHTVVETNSVLHNA